MFNEEQLEELAAKIANLLEEKVDDVEFAYTCLDGEWFWTCRVAPKYRKRGRGRELIRGSVYACHNDPTLAAELVLEKITLYKEAGIESYYIKLKNKQ